MNHDHRNQGDDEDLRTERDAGQLLQVSLSIAASEGPGGAGPAGLEVGRQVRYRRAALERWLSRRTKVSSPDETAIKAFFSNVPV